MSLFLLSLAVFAGAALCCLSLAVLRPTRQRARLANLLGVLGASAGSAVGLWAILSTPFATPLEVTLPFGLPVGACTLSIDPLGRLFLLPVFVLGALTAVKGAFSLAHELTSHNLAVHWFFFLMLLLGMSLVMAANDTVLFLLSWEIMSLAPFFLIDFHDSEKQVRDASWIYLTAAHLGAVFLLALFVLLWQKTGTTTISSPETISIISCFSPELRSLLFVLALLGFGAKAGLAPMHVWLPEAHPAAPSHVSALLSGAMINAGLYGILRITSLLSLRSTPESWWGWTLLVLGLATALTGIFKALAQSNLKRLLAYSSVENMGIMLMGAGVGLIGYTTKNFWMTTFGFAACLYHMLNHAAFKGLLFLGAGEVLHATGTVNMAYLGGLHKKMPLLGLLFAVGAASIASLPPFNGFVSEYLLALALLDAPRLVGSEQQVGVLLSLVGLGVISGFALALYVKAYGIPFLGTPRSGFSRTVHAPTPLSLWPLVLLALLCLLLSLAAARIFPHLAGAVSSSFPPPHTWDVASLLQDATNGLSTICLTSLGLIFLSLLFLLFRSILLRGKKQEVRGTWSCGYQESSPRIQYTDASFTEPSARFLKTLMGVTATVRLDNDIFPKESHLSVSAPPRLIRLFYTPLFQGIETVCNALKIMQHGKIHIYILYILVTLCVLLIWGVY